MTDQLNKRALALAEDLAAVCATCRVELRTAVSGSRLLDCGVHVEGGLHAGLALARVCMAGLGDVSLVYHRLEGSLWPFVEVVTDAPVEGCLLSQYAGWQISLKDYFAMASGPVRAVVASEELFDRLSYHETASQVVGVLESSRLPNDRVIRYVAESANVDPAHVFLLVAPTSSPAGNVQVVARSVETALHKLFELDFDVRRIRSACGTVPLPPVAADDLTGIGRTNDAILYGGCVTLWVTGDDTSLQKVGEQVPSEASTCYGQPFLEVFEAAGRDFYQIDPHFFSPAEIVFHNLDTGRVHRFGKACPEILRASFELAAACGQD